MHPERNLGAYVPPAEVRHSYFSTLRAEGFPIVRSRGKRFNLRRVLLFGLLSGCFITLVSVAVSAVLVLCGLVPLSPSSGRIYWLLVIFGLSSVSIIIAILVYESFCEPTITR